MSPANRYYRGPQSDHFDGVRFFSPGQPATDRGLAQILRWKLGTRPARWPNAVQIEQAMPDDRANALRITMVGHATLLIQAAGFNILTDPVWSERASPFRFAGPNRVTRPGIAFEALPPIDAVLLSHNHYDHLDMATLARLHDAHRPLLVMPLGNDAIVRRAVPDARIATGDWSDRVALGDDIAAHIVRANHWSARGVRDRRMALWCGYWIETPAGSIYFAGDTGYGDGAIFRVIRASYGAADVALIPIGAFAPRWFMAAQHVNPKEAVRIMEDVGAARALGIHWGTFQLTDEARDAPVMELRAALAESGIDAARFIAAEAGGVYRFPPG